MRVMAWIQRQILGRRGERVDDLDRVAWLRCKKVQGKCGGFEADPGYVLRIGEEMKTVSRMRGRRFLLHLYCLIAMVSDGTTQQRTWVAVVEQTNNASCTDTTAKELYGYMRSITIITSTIN